MNATIHAHPTLQLPEQPTAGRRRQIGHLVLDEPAMARFNQELRAVAPNAPRVSADQLVTLARELQDMSPEQANATVSERLARAERLRAMLRDGDWSLSPELEQRGRRLLAYLEKTDDLIPDEQPVVGHLDDAVLIELSWYAFVGEEQDWVDFCKFRQQHRLKGSREDRINAWEHEVLAQAALIQHKQQVRQRGYARSEPLIAPLRVR